MPGDIVTRRLQTGRGCGVHNPKAVMLDLATRVAVASHYTRTQGNPVATARECLRGLVHQVGKPTPASDWKRGSGDRF